MKRYLERPGIIVLLVLVWRAALLLTAAQPVPGNDSFFYDGPVVHYWNHGGYFSPSVAQSRPISGTEFFCAYPPLYQVVLLPWMGLFGTTALSAMWFHLALFGGFALTLLAIFRQLKVPALAANLASLFLLAITFDDRPDGLACLLTALAVYALARWFNGARGWAWVAAMCSVLTFCTSLQTGGLCSGWVFLTLAAGALICRTRPPIGALAMVVLAPLALALTVRFGFPHLWAGFQENLHGTAVGGAHLPGIENLLKVGRNVPALLLMAALIVATPAGRQWLRTSAEWRGPDLIFAVGLLGALGFIFACLVVVPANWVLILNYFQPLLAGIFFTIAATRFPALAHRRAAGICLALLVALVSVRALGLTTWGVACSLKNSYVSARECVAEETSSAPAGMCVLLSSAYLYEADRHTGGQWIHEDYAPLPEEQEDFARALRRLQAGKLVLTQYDFYRRYQRVLDDLRAQGGVSIAVTNLAAVHTPDSYPSLQKVLQHISWAPVVVNLKWEAGPARP